MSTIGLDRLVYAKITEDESGNETYGVPRTLAKAMDADLSVDVAEATLYADDGAAEHISEFQSGKLTLGVNDIGRISACDLTGASVDDNGVLISGSEDTVFARRYIRPLVENRSFSGLLLRGGEHPEAASAFLGGEAVRLKLTRERPPIPLILGNHDEGNGKQYAEQWHQDGHPA